MALQNAFCARGSKAGSDGNGNAGQRLAEWMLRQDRVWAERLDAGRFPPDPSREGDFLHQAGHLSLVLFRREMSPAGQRIEREDLLHGVLARAEALASITGGGENVVG